MNEKDWIELFLRYHENGHFYWKTVIGIPMVTMGWGAIAKTQIHWVVSIFICIFFIIIYISIFKALMKIYLLARGAAEELKLEALKRRENTPYAISLEKLDVISDKEILWVSTVFCFISCLIVVIKVFL